MIDSINFLFPNYSFLIGGIIVTIIAAAITYAFVSDSYGDTPPIIPAIIIFVVCIIATVVIHSFYNKNIKRRNTLAVSQAISLNEEACGEKLSNINAYIVERNNTLINLADIIKSYNEYESNTLVEIVKAKSGLSYSAVLSRVNETYPRIRSIENYSRLISELESTEKNIRNARLDYNNAVKCYNSIITNKVYMDCVEITGLSPKKYLEDSVTEDYSSTRIMKE